MSAPLIIPDSDDGLALVELLDRIGVEQDAQDSLASDSVTA